MGCVCGKSSSKLKDNEESPKVRELIRKTSQLHLARAVSTKKEIFLQNEKLENGNSKLIPVDRNRISDVSDRAGNDSYEKKIESSERVNNSPGSGCIPRAANAELVAAGWPSWLVSVAGEAIRGWIPRKAETFEKLDKIGQGTYSNVYKGRDLVHNKFVALKKVRFNNMDSESVKFMAREITILRRLDHPNIIKLEGLITSKTSTSLYLVFEYMEHDLTGIASLPGVKFTEQQVKCYMQQFLTGLDYCHSHSILHRDIKGSNLLIDNRGILKIADFGLASCYDNQQKVPLTTRVVTLWYRPPELLLGSNHYGVAVDLWSAGCILGELYTGRPILTGRNEVEQLHNIFKLCGSPTADYWKNSKLTYSPGFRLYRRCIAEAFKDLPDVAVALMDTLLSINPLDRGTASSALHSKYFKTEPLACDPSSLPKYPPSKELDAKLRQEDAKMKRSQGSKGGMLGGHSYRASKELRAGRPMDAATSELARSSMKSSNPRGPMETGELSNLHKDHPKDPKEDDGISYSAPLAPNPVRKSHMNRRCDYYLQVGNSSSDKMASLEIIGSRTSEPPVGKQDTRLESRMFPNSHQAKSSRIIEEDDVAGERERVKDYHFSGPLVTSSSKIEQVMRDHDRLLQEASRRMRQQQQETNRWHHFRSGNGNR